MGVYDPLTPVESHTASALSSFPAIQGGATTRDLDTAPQLPLTGRMKGLRSHLQLRRGVVRWMIAVWLLPVLLGLLPTSVLPAAAALERDLAFSICSPLGSTDPLGGGSNGDHHQHCILCAAGCPVLGPAPGAAGTLLPLPREKAVLALASPTDGYFVFGQVLLDGSPPRGPPSFS